MPEAEGLKPALHCRPQDVGGVITVACLPGKAVYRDNNQPKRAWVGGVVVSKARKASDIELQVFPCEFESCFGVLFPYYGPSLPFSNSNAYSVSICVGSMEFSVRLSQGLQLEDCLGSQKKT